MREVRRFEQLLSDVGAVVGRVRGVVGHAAVVVDESHEPGVFHAVGLGAHRRHAVPARSAECRPRSGCRSVRSAILRMRPMILLACFRVATWSSRSLSRTSNLRLGEPRAEVAQDIVRVIPASPEPTELCL